MKKLVYFFAVVALLVAPLGLSGCVNPTGDYTVYMPDGATAISLSYMMQNHKVVDGKQVSYNVVPVSTITTYVGAGEDLVVLPINAAVNLYNKGADYKLAAVLTHGNLFVVGPQQYEGQGLEALKGKVVAVIGKGAIPEFVFKYVLAGNGISYEEGEDAVSDKVVLNFAEDATDALGLVNGGKADLAMIAEPAVTTAVSKPALGLKELFNLQDEWESLTGLSGYPQAALFVKNSVESEFINEFLSLLVKGDGWAQANPVAAGQAAKDHAKESTEVKLPDMTAEVIERCNVFTKTEGIKEYLTAFYDKVSTAPTVSPAYPKDDGVFFAA